jgi:hypothetical protein
VATRHIIGMAAIAGIGFTVSIFVAGLAAIGMTGRALPKRHGPGSRRRRHILEAGACPLFGLASKSFDARR